MRTFDVCEPHPQVGEGTKRLEEHDSAALSSSDSKMLLFALAVLWAIVWLFNAVLSWRFPARAMPSRGQVAACANFGFWALAGLLAVAIRAGALKSFQPFMGLPEKTVALPMLMFCTIAFVLGCWLVPVVFLSWKRDRRFRVVRARRQAKVLPRQFWLWRRVAWLVFGLSAFFVASTGSDRLFAWDDATLVWALFLVLLGGSLVLSAGLEIVRGKEAGEVWPHLKLEGEHFPSDTPRSLRLVRGGAWMVAALCAFLVFGTESGFFDAPALSEAISVPLGLVALGVSGKLNRKIGRGDGFFFGLAARSAGVLALTWSVVFLGVALAVWPLRVELNHQLDRRLSMKETDWMKEQLHRFPPDEGTN